MKTMKKVLALLVAVLMIAASMSVAFAADTGSIKINNANGITSTHNYEAYQVFKGNLSTTNKLSDIQWGDGVDGDALLTELKTQDAYKDCADAAAVAKVLEGFGNNSTELKAFNDIVAKHLVPAKKHEGTTTSGINNLPYGYYFVKDVTQMPADGSDATSAYIIQLVGQVTLNIKADAPSIVKKIVVGQERLDTSNGAIGDTVKYEIKTHVPDMTNYRNYYFNVTDKLSKGLDYTNGSLTVTIGGSAYALENNELTVGTKDPTNGTQIDIDFKRLFAQFKDTANTQVVANAEIVITYEATINEDAIIGSTGNPNEVKLTYTNDANWDGNGDTEHPHGPTGVTPWDKTITYVTEIEIIKIDAGSKNKLEGAVFQITGNTLNKVIITGEVFEAVSNASEGEYWKLKDGSYTTTASTDATADLYASTSQKYKKVAKKTIVPTPGESVVYEGVSDANGKVTFTGLPAGDYVITEIAAPAGYNKLNGAINVSIDWTKPVKADDPGIDDVADTCKWEYTTSGVITNAKTEATGGKITYTVENNQGSTLPSTGGIGTTIFYIAGSLLAIGAAILLITKRRMGSDE